MKIPVMVLVICLFYAPLFSQGFEPPSEGKAVIYFTRVTGMGFAIGFEFFHQNRYIGDFAGRNYMRYECEPGNHLFWASSENKEFLTAEVKAGETYVVIVDVLMGIGIARVGLTPITGRHRDFERAKKLIDRKAPVVNTTEEIENKNVRLAEFIQKKLDDYNARWKEEKDFKHLSSDMAIPLTLL